MRSASVSLACATLVVLLLSLLADDADSSPLPNGAGNIDDLHMHHLTRSRYCGRKLTETLAMLCQGRYPMMSHHRSEYLSDQPQQPVEVEVATLPDSGVTHGYPHSRNAHRRVRRQGIYDECCKKSCSYTELKSYCEWWASPKEPPVLRWWQAAWVSQTPHKVTPEDSRWRACVRFYYNYFPKVGKC